MKQNIYKFSPFTFSRKEMNVSKVVENNKQHIQGKIDELIEKNISFVEHVDELSKLINDKSDFYDSPADTRFPFNLSDLSTHLRFTAGVMYLLVENAVKRFGLEYTLKAFGFPDSLDEATLFAISRFTGLMHDITKPAIDNHSENSADFAEKCIKNLSITGNQNVDSGLKNMIVNAIKNHHESNSNNGFEDLIKVADWISTSDRIKIVWPEFLSSILEKYGVDDVAFGANKKDREDIMKSFKQYIDMINSNGSSLTKGSADDVLYDSLKNKTKTMHWRSKNTYPYFLEPSSVKAVEEKLGIISNRLNANISKDKKSKYLSKEPLLTFVKMEFKKKQDFIYRSPELKHIKGGSLLIQIFEEIFEKAFCKISCQETILSKGGGELFGLISIDFDDKKIMEEVKNEFKIWVTKNFKDKLTENEINELTEDLVNNYISVETKTRPLSGGIRDNAFTFVELLFGLNLEKDYEKSFNDEYYYNLLQDPKISLEQKRGIIKYFFDATYLSQKFNTSTDYLKNLDSFISQVTKSEFFIQFQNRKGFGELISAFEVYPSYPSQCQATCLPSVGQAVSLCQSCHSPLSNGSKCLICNFKSMLSESFRTKPKLYDNLVMVKILKNIKERLIKKNIITQKNISIGDLQIYDLDQLGKNCIFNNNEDYIAYMKFDGNNFGIMKQQLKTVGMFQAFSRSINLTALEAITEAIVNSVVAWYNAHSGSKKPPLEDIPVSLFIVGGDDLSLAMHSELAFKFVETFSEEIEKRFGKYIPLKNLKDRVGEVPISFYPTGYSGGVVFHKSSVPLQISNEIADILESKSKKFSKFYLRPYRDWKGLAANVMNVQKNLPYTSRCLEVYQPPGDIIVGGAYNTISMYFSTADLSKEAVERYYNGKTFKYYSTALFPMDITALKNDFIGRIKDILKIAGYNEDKSNVVKSLLRTGVMTMPEEFQLSLYYKAGKENSKEKQELWQKMANSLFIKSRQYRDEDSNETKYVIDWYEPCEFSRFYWE